MSDRQFTLQPIGHIESSLVDAASAPKQGDEGGPEAWLIVAPEFADGLRDFHPGDEILMLTWLDILGTKLRVAPLEAIDGTPVLDLKPVLDPSIER
jgi:tRNA (Thr-GGU) A37 N-methylase